MTAHPDGHTAPQEGHAMSEMASASFVIPASSAASAVKTGSAVKSKKSKRRRAPAAAEAAEVFRRDRSFCKSFTKHGVSANGNGWSLHDRERYTTYGGYSISPYMPAMPAVGGASGLLLVRHCHLAM